MHRHYFIAIQRSELLLKKLEHYALKMFVPVLPIIFTVVDGQADRAKYLATLLKRGVVQAIAATKAEKSRKR